MNYKHRLTAGLILLLFFATLYTVQNEIPQAHASHVGKVCIASDADVGAGLCPSTPPVFTGPVTTPPTQLRVPIFLDTSSSLNAFAITIITDSTILKPADADLTGSLLIGTPIVILKCIGGVPRVGTACPATATADTIRLDATNALGTGVTPHPTTGLLFTAVFNITGTTTGTGITVGFQTGCSPTSVPPDTCVTLSDGTITPVPETVQIGGFNNNTPPPFVSISANPANLGQVLPGGFTTSTITATPQNGYESQIDPSVEFSTRVTTATGLSASMIPPSVDLSGGAQPSTLTVSTTTQTPVGNYQTIVFSLYHLTDSATFVVSTLVAPVELPVKVVDFTITASPTSVGPLVPGTPGTATITVGALNGFTGTVTLTTTAVSSTDLTAALSTTSIAGQGTATLTVSSSAIGTYTLKVRGTSGTRIRDTATITVTVNVVHDLAISSFTTSTTSTTIGSQVTFTITVQNKGTVTETDITVTALAGDLTVARQNVTLTAGQTQQVTLPWDTTGHAAGTYTLSVRVQTVTGETSTTDNQQTSSSTFSLTAPTEGPLSQNLLLIIAIAAIIALAVVLLFLRARSRRTKQTA